MSYRIVIDSCGELTQEMKESEHFVSVPLTLLVDDFIIMDDESFDQADFLKKVAESPNCPKSSCPSPEAYMKAFECGKDRLYAVTISGELSGSYNSAMLGRNLFMEKHPDAKIHVFNSLSASVAETLIGLKIQECEEAGMEFEKVVETVEAYISEQHTWFVLENLETLRKNGRLSKTKAIVASALNIKPVMIRTEDGSIKQIDQARGMNKAIAKMVEYVVKTVENSDKKKLAICHCNCIERAKMLEEMLGAKLDLKEILILDTAGVSSMYTNDGGVIVVA